MPLTAAMRRPCPRLPFLAALAVAVAVAVAAVSRALACLVPLRRPLVSCRVV